MKQAIISVVVALSFVACGPPLEGEEGAPVDSSQQGLGQTASNAASTGSQQNNPFGSTLRIVADPKAAQNATRGNRPEFMNGHIYETRHGGGGHCP